MFPGCSVIMWRSWYVSPVTWGIARPLHTFAPSVGVHVVVRFRESSRGVVARSNRTCAGELGRSRQVPEHGEGKPNALKGQGVGKVEAGLRDVPEIQGFP